MNAREIRRDIREARKQGLNVYLKQIGIDYGIRVIGARYYGIDGVTQVRSATGKWYTVRSGDAIYAN